MPSLQTQAALDAVSELYGTPNWLAEPKKGLKIETVLAQWDAALKGYTEEQVKTAVQKLWKYAKTASAPRLGHILAELSDVAPENDDAAGNQRAPVADDTAGRLTERYVKNGCRGRLCFASDVAKAFDAMLNDMAANLPREATAGKTHSDLLQLARNNGYLAQFEDYLAEVTKNRIPYQPIGGELRFIDVPEGFSPNNERRKCA